MIPAAAPGPWAWILAHAHHAQAFTTLVLFASFVAFRYFIPRNDPEFWESRPTRVVVHAIGAGALVSLLGWLVELPSGGVSPGARLVGPYLNHLTAALLLPGMSVVVSRVLPTLQDDPSAGLRTALEARTVWVVVVAGVLVGSGVVLLASLGALQGADPFDPRAGTSASANLYRLGMSLAPTFFAVLLCALLLEASLRGAPGDEGGLRRRWRHLSLGLGGFAFLEAKTWAVPLFATLFPNVLTGAGAAATSRILDVPAFAAIGIGAYLAFSQPPEHSESDRMWSRYELYKSLLEGLEAKINGFGAGTQMLTPHWHQETILLRRLLRHRDIGAASRVEDATVAYGLLALAASRPEELRNINASLVALGRLNKEFASHPEGTEPRLQAEGDSVAPVAPYVRLLLDRRSPPRLVPQPDWLQVVAYVAANAGLLSPEQGPREVLSRRAHLICGRVHNARGELLMRPDAA